MSTEDYFIAAGLRPRKKTDYAKRKAKLIRLFRRRWSGHKYEVDILYRYPFSGDGIILKEIESPGGSKHNMHLILIKVKPQREKAYEKVLGYFETKEEAIAEFTALQTYLTKTYGV